MSNTRRLTIPQARDILVAPRQMWLATLGAAAIAREKWADKEAGSMFRALVSEGAAVESKAIRRIGERVDTSVGHAGRLVIETRRTVTTTLASFANAASAFARAKLPAIRASLNTPEPREQAAKSVKRAPKAAKGNATSRRRAAS